MYLSIKFFLSEIPPIESLVKLRDQSIGSDSLETPIDDSFIKGKY